MAEKRTKTTKINKRKEDGTKIIFIFKAVLCTIWETAVELTRLKSSLPYDIDGSYTSKKPQLMALGKSFLTVYTVLRCSSALKNVFEEILMTIWSSCCKISISSLECSFHSKQEEILVKKVHGKTISNQIKIQKFKTAIITENFCLPQDGLDIQHNFLVVVVLQFGL